MGAALVFTKKKQKSSHVLREPITRLRLLEYLFSAVCPETWVVLDTANLVTWQKCTTFILVQPGLIQFLTINTVITKCHVPLRCDGKTGLCA